MRHEIGLTVRQMTISFVVCIIIVKLVNLNALKRELLI